MAVINRDLLWKGILLWFQGDQYINLLFSKICIIISINMIMNWSFKRVFGGTENKLHCVLTVYNKQFIKSCERISLCLCEHGINPKMTKHIYSNIGWLAVKRLHARLLTLSLASVSGSWTECQVCQALAAEQTNQNISP